MEHLVAERLDDDAAQLMVTLARSPASPVVPAVDVRERAFDVHDLTEVHRREAWSPSTT